MSRFFHWYTSLTWSDVKWDAVVMVALAVSILFLYVDNWKTRGREDSRDDEVRLLKLQIENLQKSDTFASKTQVMPSPTIQAQDSDLIFDPPASDRYRHLFIGKPPISK
jgi:hypothetical protein